MLMRALPAALEEVWAWGHAHATTLGTQQPRATVQDALDLADILCASAELLCDLIKSLAKGAAVTDEPAAAEGGRSGKAAKGKPKQSGATIKLECLLAVLRSGPGFQTLLGALAAIGGLVRAPCCEEERAVREHVLKAASIAAGALRTQLHACPDVNLARCDTLRQHPALVASLELLCDLAWDAAADFRRCGRGSRFVDTLNEQEARLGRLGSEGTTCIADAQLRQSFACQAAQECGDLLAVQVKDLMAEAAAAKAKAAVGTAPAQQVQQQQQQQQAAGTARGDRPQQHTTATGTDDHDGEVDFLRAVTSALRVLLLKELNLPVIPAPGVPAGHVHISFIRAGLGAVLEVASRHAWLPPREERRSQRGRRQQEQRGQEQGREEGQEKGQGREEGQQQQGQRQEEGQQGQQREHSGSYEQQLERWRQEQGLLQDIHSAAWSALAMRPVPRESSHQGDLEKIHMFAAQLLLLIHERRLLLRPQPPMELRALSRCLTFHHWREPQPTWAECPLLNKADAFEQVVRLATATAIRSLQCLGVEEGSADSEAVLEQQQVLEQVWELLDVVRRAVNSLLRDLCPEDVTGSQNLGDGSAAASISGRLAVAVSNAAQALLLCDGGSGGCGGGGGAAAGGVAAVQQQQHQQLDAFTARWLQQAASLYLLPAMCASGCKAIELARHHVSWTCLLEDSLLGHDNVQSLLVQQQQQQPQQAATAARNASIDAIELLAQSTSAPLRGCVAALWAAQLQQQQQAPDLPEDWVFPDPPPEVATLLLIRSSGVFDLLGEVALGMQALLHEAAGLWAAAAPAAPGGGRDGERRAARQETLGKRQLAAAAALPRLSATAALVLELLVQLGASALRSMLALIALPAEQRPARRGGSGGGGGPSPGWQSDGEEQDDWVQCCLEWAHLCTGHCYDVARGESAAAGGCGPGLLEVLTSDAAVQLLLAPGAWKERHPACRLPEGQRLLQQLQQPDSAALLPALLARLARGLGGCCRDLGHALPAEAWRGGARQRASADSYQAGLLLLTDGLARATEAGEEMVVECGRLAARESRLMGRRRQQQRAGQHMTSGGGASCEAATAAGAAAAPGPADASAVAARAAAQSALRMANALHMAIGLFVRARRGGTAAAAAAAATAAAEPSALDWGGLQRAFTERVDLDCRVCANVRCDSMPSEPGVKRFVACGQRCGHVYCSTTCLGEDAERHAPYCRAGAASEEGIGANGNGSYHEDGRLASSSSADTLPWGTGLGRWEQPGWSGQDQLLSEADDDEGMFYDAEGDAGEPDWDADTYRDGLSMAEVRAQTSIGDELTERELADVYRRPSLIDPELAPLGESDVATPAQLEQLIQWLRSRGAG